MGSLSQGIFASISDALLKEQLLLLSFLWPSCFYMMCFSRFGKNGQLEDHSRNWEGSISAVAEERWMVPPTHKLLACADLEQQNWFGRGFTGIHSARN